MFSLNWRNWLSSFVTKCISCKILLNLTKITFNHKIRTEEKKSWTNPGQKRSKYWVNNWSNIWNIIFFLFSTIEIESNSFRKDRKNHAVKGKKKKKSRRRNCPQASSHSSPRGRTLYLFPFLFLSFSCNATLSKWIEVPP